MHSNVITVALIGDKHVGKTAVAQKQVRGKYPETSEKTFFDTFKINVSHEGIPYQIQILDLSGDCELVQEYLTPVQGFIIVHDISKPKTLEHAEQLVKVIKEYKSHDYLPVKIREQHGLPCFPLLLLGNKIDLLPSAEECYQPAREFAKKHFELNQDAKMDRFCKFTSVQHTENEALTAMVSQIVQYEHLKNELLAPKQATTNPAVTTLQTSAAPITPCGSQYMKSASSRQSNGLFSSLFGKLL